MKRAIIAVISVLPIGLFCTDAYACHKFSRWRYPWPQSCRTVIAYVPKPVARPVVLDIPIPDLSADWGGTMDTELELQLQRQKAIRRLTERGQK